MEVQFIQVGMTLPSKRFPDPEPMRIPCRGYMCAYVLAQPRYGKGGLAKDWAVKLSKHRRMCFIDYNGEWSRHVTHPNYRAQYPDFIAEFKVYRDFTFKLSDFLAAEDWVSMGFNRPVEIRDLFLQTMQVHKGEPERFIRILVDLPTETKNSPMTVDEFNDKYDAEINIGAHIETKGSWIRTMNKVKGWFWQGEEDVRPIYDFGKEWVENRHIFVDFSLSNTDAYIKFRNRTFLGKIMELLKDYYKKIQGIIWVEEADVLLPRWHTAEGIKPSSNQQVITYVAKAPKYQMGIVLIMQHIRQSDEDIRIGGQFMYLLGMYPGYPYPFRMNSPPRLRYYPESNYREFLFIDVNLDWKRFVPGIPCCEYDSNIKGEDKV